MLLGMIARIPNRPRVGPRLRRGAPEHVLHDKRAIALDLRSALSLQERADLFRRIRAQADRVPECAGASARPAIWLASASIDRSNAAAELRRCTAAAQAAGLYAELVVTNDVTPLILGAPPDVGHVVVVCGTGSAFLATNGRSALVRVGGCEYLGSDEGSAFDLGLRGLRAAVCALDGRGQRTALSELLAAEAGMPVPELSRKLAGMPFPKAAVAALAPVVLRAWLDGQAQFKPAFVRAIEVCSFARFRQDGTLDPERDERKNIAELAELLVRELPLEAQVELARLLDVKSVQKLTAQRLLRSMTAISAAIGAQPIPLADFPILTTLQVAMVAGIMYLGGRELSLRSAAEFCAAMGTNISLGMILREGARAAVKVIPGWGNAISGGVAAAGTYAIGRAAMAVFVEGKALAEARRVLRWIRRKNSTLES